MSTTPAQTASVFFSVFDGGIHYWSRFGRVIVGYDTQNNRWMCGCCRAKRNCVHKSVAKWFVYEVDPSLLSDVCEKDDSEYGPLSDEGSGQDLEESFPFSDISAYPPKGAILDAMVLYQSAQKKVPTVLPQGLLTEEVPFPSHFIPREEACHVCQSLLGDPCEVTNRAMIIGLTKVITDIHTFYKECPTCGMMYRYQEYKDGLHNYDDLHLFSLTVLRFLRALMQENTAVGRTSAALKSICPSLSKVSDSVFRNAYYHFEALSDHDYNYFCQRCGHHPPILIWDLCKKGCFPLALDDLEVPLPSETNDSVDLTLFWEQVEHSVIARGLLRGQSKDNYCITPSYTFWAPWIGQFTRRSCIVYNTEYRKSSSASMASKTDFCPEEGCRSDHKLSEEDLVEMIEFSEVKTLQDVCKQFHLKDVSRMSKLECVSFLRTKLGIPKDFNKIFSKIWGASGGWASGSCPHMVVYCLKFVLRGESPRDYADLLRSLKFPPSISICDIPDRLASHVNSTVPGFFSPHEGRLFELTEENLAAAEQGMLEKRLPWLQNEGAPSLLQANNAKEIHPTTKVGDRYCLCDRFHERNSSQRRALLRRVTLVPELNGIINTEAEEQLHSSIGRSNYCLNTMKPANHLFMMRLKIHLHNTNINGAFKDSMEKTFSAQAGHAVQTDFDLHGRLFVLRERTGFHQRSKVEPSSTHLLSNSPPAVSPIEFPPGEEYSSPTSERTLSPVIPVSASKAEASNRRTSSTDEVSKGRNASTTGESTSSQNSLPSSSCHATKKLATPSSSSNSKKIRGSSAFFNSLRSAAKQAADEQALLVELRKDCVVKSMAPSGDCAFELMCKWQKVLAFRRFGRPVPMRVIEETVSSQQILSMRHAVADLQYQQVFDKENATMQELVKQSLIDWRHSPEENGGRNAEVQVAIQSLPGGVREEEWFDSMEAMDLHSTLIRTGKKEVFAEAAELEAFSLMEGNPLAIYLPGHCELFPKSNECNADQEYLLGICNGTHYYLAVPKTWIESSKRHTTGRGKRMKADDDDGGKATAAHWKLDCTAEESRQYGKEVANGLTGRLQGEEPRTQVQGVLAKEGREETCPLPDKGKRIKENDAAAGKTKAAYRTVDCNAKENRQDREEVADGLTGRLQGEGTRTQVQGVLVEEGGEGTGEIKVSYATEDFKEAQKDMNVSQGATPLWKPLTEDETHMVQAIWAMDKKTELRKVIVKRYNMQLTWLDLKRVQHPVDPQEKSVIDKAIHSNEASFQCGWLNDEVVNFYFSLLEDIATTIGNHAFVTFSSFFYKRLLEGPLDKGIRWRRKTVEVAKTAELVFPLHVNKDHWCLGVIRYQAKQLVHYDPQGNNQIEASGFFQLLRSYLKAKAAEEGWDALSIDSWKEKIIRAPVQPDKSSCGAFICMMAQRILEKSDFDFCKMGVLNLRSLIMRNILKCNEIIKLYREMSKVHLELESDVGRDVTGSDARNGEGTEPTECRKHILIPEDATIQPKNEYAQGMELRRRSTLKRPYKSAEWELPYHIKAKQVKYGKGILDAKQTAMHDHSLKTEEESTVDSLPDEILELIFENVCQTDGDAAIASLSLVCRRWQEIIASDVFRRRVHFKWLGSIYDWEKASADFKEQYFVMYDIQDCWGCGRRFKSMPGFMQQRKGASLKFYSDGGGHPCYCSEFCDRMYGYSDETL